MNIFSGVRVLTLIKFFFPSFKAFVFWPPYIIFCYSFILLFLLRLDGIQTLRRTLIYTFPFMMYFFMSILILDAALLIIRHSGILLMSPSLYAARTGIALTLTIIVMICAHFHAKDIKHTFYTVNIKREAGTPIRIALIADLHIGGSTDSKWLANMVDAVNQTKPDIILLAGDIFDTDLRTMPDKDKKTEEFKQLSAPLGIYAIPGNHDVDRHSPWEAASTDGIKEFLENAGIIFLLDEVHLINEIFYLVGRRDIRPIGGGPQRKSALNLVEDLDKTKPIIFMDHQPLDFRLIEEAGADLILSGHTHKGQFFPGSIATYFIFKRAGASHYGHWRGSSAQAIITSGISAWGPILRLGTKSEVAVVDLNFTATLP